MLQSAKRSISVAVAAATIALSAGFAGLVPAQAEAASAGDLIKGSLSTVYYYGYDGGRYVFPNSNTFFTWFQNFNSVTTVSDSALSAIPLRGNVVYRPGSYWVKIQSDARVYVVSTNGVLHHIDGMDPELGGMETAEDYAGSNWASMIHDVPDSFFTDYTVGASLMTAEAFDGMLYMDGGNYYIAWDGEKRMVTSAGRSANNLQAGFFLDGSGIDDSDLTAGDDITGAVTALMDPAQTESEVPSEDGDVSVSLASSTPAATSIADGASGVRVATYAVRASEDAEIDVMTVSLSGLAATTEFSNVYLYEGNERLTNGKTFNSSTREATFGSLNFAIESGETRYISVVVDMANSGHSTSFAVSLAEEADVETMGDVSGSFPITGSTMSIVNATVGAVTITSTGSVADPTVGQNDATIAKFRLAAYPDEDVNFESITLKVADADDHMGYELYQGTTKVATGTNIGDDLVLFDLTSAFEIEKGENRDFTVKADVGGEAGDTIKVYLDNNADLYVVGQQYGFGVTVTATAWDTLGEATSTTIEGGEITVVFNGPVQTDVATESDDVELFNFTVTAERDVTATQVVFTDAGTGDDNKLSDVRLVNAETGALVAGPESLSSGTVTFDEEFDIEAGEELTLKLTADLESADAADTFVFTLDISEFDLEDAEGTAVTDVVPSTDLVGNTQTVIAAGLTVSLASTPTGTTSVVRGTAGAEVVGYNLAAANGGDVEVTDLTVTVYVNEDSTSGTSGSFTAGTEGAVLAGDRITSCSLYDASDVKLSGPKTVSSTTGEILFENFSAWVDAGTTERWEVRCDFANVPPGTADMFAWEVDAAGDVTALDEDGDPLTATASAVNGGETAVISLTGSGTLAVTAASDTPTAGFLLTGSTGVEVAKFRFDATDEAFTVNRLTITEQQATTDLTSASASAYTNNVSRVTVSYPTETGTATAYGSFTDNELTLNNLGMYVGKNDRATLTVTVDVPSTSRAGGYATSNEKVKIGLTATDSTEFSATTASATSTSLSVTTANSGVNAFVIRETEPTVSLSSTTLPVSSAGGNAEVFRFNVAANSGEDVILDQFVFKLNATAGGTEWRTATAANLSSADFVIYNREVSLSTAVAGTWTILDATADTWATSDVATFAKFVPTTAITVPANGTRSFSMWWDTTGADGDASVRVDLVADPIVSHADAITGSSTLATVTSSGAAATRDDSTLTIGTGHGANWAVGDILCNAGGNTACAAGEERMLVVAKSSDTLTVVRGYLGTNVGVLSTGDNVQRIPSSFVWQDDGNDETTESVDDMWGSYLVDGLTLYGQQFNY